MRKATLVIATGLILGLAAPAHAVDEPENVIKYRQAVMKAIGGHISAIVAVAKGEVSFAGHVAAHARGIHEMSSLIPDIFPKGTDRGTYPDTRALPKIWAERGEFEAAVKKLQAESAKMIQVARDGDVGAIGGQLRSLGKACGGCHKPFRAEKK